MRAAFLIAVLCVALLYTYQAFFGLNFLSAAGRLGPGFFPRLLGLGLVIACIYALVVDHRQGLASAQEDSPFWTTCLTIAALSFLFVLSLNILGGPVAMVVFLLVTLSYLNRGHLVQNAFLSLVFPLSIYLLFDVWLNASLPEGILPLPI